MIESSKNYGHTLKNSFLFNVKLEDILDYLPNYLTPYEIEPGISQIILGVTVFENKRYEATFDLFWGVLVNADQELSNNKGDSAQAFYVVNHASDSSTCRKFVLNNNKMHIYDHDISLDIDSNSGNLKIKDYRGQNIATLKNAKLDSAYEKTEQLIHCYASQETNSDLYYAKCRSFGEFCNNKQNKSNWGKLYNHPFFLGLDVENIKDNNLQTILKPGELSFIEVEEIKKLY